MRSNIREEEDKNVKYEQMIKNENDELQREIQDILR